MPISLKQMTLGATLALFAVLGGACATAPVAASHTMLVGAAVAPPAGFVEFCARQPVDCDRQAPAVVSPSVSAAVAEPVAPVALPAPAGRWAMAFQQARAAEGLGGPAALQAPAEQRINWSKAFAEARLLTVASRSMAVDGMAELAADVTVAPRPASEAQPVALSPALWAKVNRVNQRINSAIIRREDRASYGQLDYWAMPLSGSKRGFGDCEDYVLEKRSALLKLGVPAEALSIAVVTTSWNEMHAVLLLTTDRGEMVLDNLSSWILPWDQVDYVWRERQSGGAMQWAAVATDRPVEQPRLILAMQ